jgi:GrpB-like predicted nucleotidyltransferase (UPF0157 family)
MNNKYVFKPYSKIFPELFQKEKERIIPHLKGVVSIEHIGSTAVPGLGGKGIIDIAIAVNQADMDSTCKDLQTLGYDYRPTFSTQDRFYFVIYLPDKEEDTRRYHIHLTYPKNKEWEELLRFRDYLRSHPQALQEYANLKQQAASEANNDGKRYRKLKEPMFKQISSIINKDKPESS